MRFPASHDALGRRRLHRTAPARSDVPMTDTGPIDDSLCPGLGGWGFLRRRVRGDLLIGNTFQDSPM